MRALIIVWAALLASCSSKPMKDTPHSELVMGPGMTITATNDQGSIRIEYIDRYTRRYSWDEHVKIFRHQPRETRWFGSLGIYRPYGDGTMHAVLQEGQMPFANMDEAYAWLKKSEHRMDLVWTKDGLVVGWKQQARPGNGYLALSAEVWQILINGKKPVLKGSEPEKIQVTTTQAEPADAGNRSSGGA